MSDTSKANGPAHKTKSLNDLIGPIVISAIAEVLVSSIKSLPPDQRMLIIVVLGVIYTAITSRSEGQRGLTVSKKAAVVLTLLFLLAIILVLLAYLILNLDPLQTLVLVGWMILMLAALFISRIVPDSQVFLKSLLANLAAFSLGGGIAIGGAPVVKLVLSLAGAVPAFLIIQNNCSSPITNDEYGLVVQPFGSQAVKAPAVSFTLERREGLLVARALQVQRDIPLDDS